jgi:DNA-binding sugar fermentation-stimulating protein
MMIMQLSKNKRMVVTLNVEGYGEIKNANIQNVGKFAAISESGKRILYTVSYHKGSKIVTVTSPVLVENKTAFPIQVLVEIKDSDSKPIELAAIRK